MRKYILIAMLLVAATGAKAQIFNFGFGDDFFQPRVQQRQQEPITKPEYDGDKQDMEDFMKENFKNPVNQREVEGKIVIAGDLMPTSTRKRNGWRPKCGSNQRKEEKKRFAHAMTSLSQSVTVGSVSSN